MNKREISKRLTPAKRAGLKSSRLRVEAEGLLLEGQKTLDRLAKDACPFKRGQIFKKRGARVWAIYQSVGAHNFRHGLFDDEYVSAPYVLECIRCSSKGVRQKGKWLFIQGDQVGSEWEVED